MRRHLQRPWFLLALLWTGAAQANNGYFTLSYENDIFVGRDYGYTAGTQLAWARGPGQHFREVAPRPIAALGQPLWLARRPDSEVAVAYKLGGAMFTPKDLENPDPPRDDMPYSGLLYWQASLHSFDLQTADHAYLLLGLIGPSSGVEPIHSAVHSATGSTRAQGWHTQLSDEAVFKLGLGRKWRSQAWELDGDWGLDLISFGELGAGTLDSTLDVGLIGRWGRNLLRSYPTAGVLPGRDTNPLAGARHVEFNVFLAVMGRYMPNAVYIEGNNFDGRRSGITLVQEQLYLAGGVLWNWGDWGFLYSLAYSSKWFEEADGTQFFGSLSVTHRF